MYVSEAHFSSSAATILVKCFAETGEGEDARSLERASLISGAQSLEIRCAYSEVENRKKGEVFLNALATAIVRANAPNGLKSMAL